MLSEDDRNPKAMTAGELVLAWDLWFDLAQTTNDSDPPYTHGVFVGVLSRHFDRAHPTAPGATEQSGAG
jgi:hypothetical protein